MESVPEARRMDEFHSSPPLPVFRITDSALQGQLDNSKSQSLSKPPCCRRATEPTPTSDLGWVSKLQYRPRHGSPLAGGHTRSRSSTSLQPLPMHRTKSAPGAAGTVPFPTISTERPLSPAHNTTSPNRNRRMKKPVDEGFPAPLYHPSSIGYTESGDLWQVGTGQDDAHGAEERSWSPTPGLASQGIYSRSPRPSSPFRHIPRLPAEQNGSATPSPMAASASSAFQSARYDAFNLANFPVFSSSVPTTPSSIRSRSPSISSLETIPDAPAAEEAALEAERIAQLKAAADAADRSETNEGKKQVTLDTMLSRGRRLGPSIGSRDKSKRWSVCGAERRGDLDLETIWED